MQYFSEKLFVYSHVFGGLCVCVYVYALAVIIYFMCLQATFRECSGATKSKATGS